MNCSPLLAASLLLLGSPLLAQASKTAEMSSEVAALLDRVAKARGADSLPGSLRVTASYKVMFEGAPEDQPAPKGAASELYRGEHLARHTTEMGPMGKMERGLTDELAWEMDPSMGAKRYDGPAAASFRRYFAVMRGVRPEKLYSKIERRPADARTDYVVLDMHAASGEPDLVVTTTGVCVLTATTSILMFITSISTAGCPAVIIFAISGIS